MKYCKDCRFFRGNLTDDEVDFLESMLRRYDARLMLNSWVKLGQVKIPSGRKIDFEKAEAVRILKRTLKNMFMFTLWIRHVHCLNLKG